MLDMLADRKKNRRRKRQMLEREGLKSVLVRVGLNFFVFAVLAGVGTGVVFMIWAIFDGVKMLFY